jgi:hypothetical protein
MHNLTALSLALPGTPLHGLDEFAPRRRPVPALLRAAAPRRKVARAPRFAVRVHRPAAR